jgi:hypothetical protein
MAIPQDRLPSHCWRSATATSLLRREFGRCLGSPHSAEPHRTPLCHSTQCHRPRERVRLSHRPQYRRCRPAHQRDRGQCYRWDGCENPALTLLPPFSAREAYLPLTLSSVRILPIYYSSIVPPSSAFAGTIPPSAVRMHFYLWQTGSRSPLVSAERAPAKTPRANSPIFLRRRATLWLPSNSLAILSPSEIPLTPVDGISPLPKDFVVPIGRPRLRRAPLVWAPLLRRKSLLISRLRLQHLRKPKPRPRLRPLPSLRPKRANRRSNLRQNPILFPLLLRLLLL